MEIKDKGSITLDKGNKKQIKCHKFQYKPMNRELMVHEDVDVKNCTSVSDSLTGFRLFKLSKDIEKVQPNDITEGLEKFVRHYTLEGIDLEFRRIENLQSQKEGK